MSSKLSFHYYAVYRQDRTAQTSSLSGCGGLIVNALCCYIFLKLIIYFIVCTNNYLTIIIGILSTFLGSLNENVYMYVNCTIVVYKIP